MSEGGGGSAALVSSLAQQLRSGAISKHQLFERLAQLQHGGGGGGAGSRSEPARPPPPQKAWGDSDAQTQGGRPQLSEQEQQELADRLAQQRLAAQSAALERAASDDSLETSSKQGGATSQHDDPTSYPGGEASEAAASMQLAYVEAQQRHEESHTTEYTDDGSDRDPRPARVTNNNYYNNMSYSSGGPGPRYSVDTSSTNFRTRPQDRLEQLEQELAEKEMAECTFRPKINQLPPQYKKAKDKRHHERRRSAAAAVSTSTAKEYTEIPFLDRVNKWQESRNKLTEAQRAERENRELDGCTFAPQVRQNARLEKRLAKRQERLSRRQSAQPAYGREEDHFAGEQKKAVDPSVGQKASERLYEHAKLRKAVLNESRVAAEASDAAAIDENCTFKPKVRGDYKTEDGGTVESRLYNPRKNAEPYDNPTFTPKTNKVKRSMGAAKHYLEADPFDRLSRPNVFSPQVNSAEDYSSGGGAFERRGGSIESSATDDVYMTPGSRAAPSTKAANTPGQGPPGTRSHGHKHTHDVPAPPQSKSNKKKFNAFIERQNRSRRRKDEVNRRIIEEVKKKETFEPKISKTSKALMAASGTFMERLEKQTRQKENLKKFLQAQKEELDPECSFKPKINKMSKYMQPRSDEQRSSGDAQKREQVVSQLKARQQHNELSEATFKPKFLTNNRGVRGKIRPDEDTQVYLQRLRQEENQAEARRRYIQAQREAEELEGCTFKPETHDAPAYVKRIARSMKLSRGPEKPVQPERRWL